MLSLRLLVALTSVAMAVTSAGRREPPAHERPSIPRSEAEAGRVSVQGTGFVNAEGAPFTWRGITAFRLAERIASGHEAEAAAYLDWSAANGITVVRVFTTAGHLFELSPEDGLRALPRLLQLAADRGLHVELVALADSAGRPVDLDAHVAAVGRIAAEHPNAFVEIANEPFHHTQHPSLHDRATLARLAALVPDEVVVAFGSDEPDTSGGGDYVTVHMPRGGTAWDHVAALGDGRALVEQYGRPVVSDEPIGAAPAAQPGRRDDSPERFRAAALLTRMTGMHATFHYEGGLHARIPEGAERAAFDAWREAWTLLPPGIEQGAFRVLPSATGHVFETRHAGRRWVLTIAGAPAPEGLDPVATWPQSGLFTGK